MYEISTIFTLVVFETEQKADTTKQREEQPSASHVPQTKAGKNHASQWNGKGKKHSEKVGGLG